MVNITPDYSDRMVLLEEVKQVAQAVIDSAYGTDPRHGVMAQAIAAKVAYGDPVPWDLSRHFGREPSLFRGDGDATDRHPDDCGNDGCSCCYRSPIRGGDDRG